MKIEAIGQQAKVAFLGMLRVVCLGSLLYVRPKGSGRTTFGSVVLLFSQTSFKTAKRISKTSYLKKSLHA
jgi:hypothetical protein